MEFGGYVAAIDSRRRGNLRPIPTASTSAAVANITRCAFFVRDRRGTIRQMIDVAAADNDLTPVLCLAQDGKSSGS
jgi:hypothetical protein